MSKHLVITAVGDDRPGIVNDLTKHISDSDCNIADSRMSILGGEFALILLLSGNWNGIAKIEESLPRIATDLGLSVTIKRTEPRNQQGNLLNYHVDALAMDQPGLVHKVTEFFSSRSINIEGLNTDSYNAAHTGTPMFSINMTVNIPAEKSISQIREQYMDFCDAMNMDGMIEPARN